MTDAPAAILATYYTWRPVAGRKSLQLIFEVPPEKQTEVLTALGPPDSTGSVWCAIALIDPKAAEAAMKAQGASAPVPNQSSPVNTREKRNWVQLSAAEQAGIRCAEPAFWRFLETEFPGWVVNSADDAANCVRSLCHVKTRADLKPGSKALQLWETLDGAYRDWMRVAVWASP